MRFIIAFTIALIMLASCRDEMGNLDCSSISSAYAADIKPLITSNCATAGCHNAGSPQGDFTSYAGIKAMADNGRLKDKVIHDKTMPPSGPLSLDDRKKLQCWLNSGAPNN